jgi:flagellar assembly protein FliH
MYSSPSSGQSVLDAERFDYPRSGPSSAGPGEGSSESRSSAAPQDQSDRHAFEQGVLQGHARAQAALQAESEQLRRTIDEALAQFRKERETYFAQVENEVVQLALAIAKKILHREAQIDPLLLAGMVRVALEKVESGTKIRMHANPEEIHIWREHFARSDKQLLSPELIGDAALQRGSCYLETEVGSTHISLEAQLKEIEQGFFDLLQRRPPVR